MDRSRCAQHDDVLACEARARDFTAHLMVNVLRQTALAWPY